jgi:hypothetical protein
MAINERLTIPPETRLLSVERLSNRRWAIWILTNETGLQKNHYERDGTYLLLNNDGSIHRETISGGVIVDLLEVMPKHERISNDYRQDKPQED